MNNYTKYNKLNKLFFHLFWMSLIILVPTIIAKWYIFAIILILLSITSLFLYFHYHKLLKLIYDKMKHNCIECGCETIKTSNDDISSDEFSNFNNMNVIITKYKCPKCGLCYFHIENVTYTHNKKIVTKEANIINKENINE